MHTLTVVFLPLLVTQVYTCLLYLILVESIQFSLLSWIIRSYSCNLFKLVNTSNTVLVGTGLPIPKKINMYKSCFLSHEKLKSLLFFQQRYKNKLIKVSCLLSVTRLGRQFDGKWETRYIYLFRFTTSRAWPLLPFSRKLLSP